MFYDHNEINSESVTEVENPQIFGNNWEINKNVLMKTSLKKINV